MEKKDGSPFPDKKKYIETKMQILWQNAIILSSMPTAYKIF